MIKGTPPTPRDSHSCTTVGDNLYVFGGTDGMNPLNDLHILDTCEQLLPLISSPLLAFSHDHVQDGILPSSFACLKGKFVNK